MSIMNETPMVLSEFAEIFIRDNFCSLVHHQKGSFAIVHPSEAFILSLLDGDTMQEDLVPVFAGTYGVKAEEAASTISLVMRKLNQYCVPSRIVAQPVRYDPQSFLFPGFDKQPNLDRPLSKPQAIGLALTTRCNFRCRYCSVGINTLYPDRMETEMALRIVEEAARLGVVHASFGGWEPLLHPDICEIVAAIRGRGMALLFSTNGSLLGDRMVDGLHRAGLKGIQVSIDAPTAELHHYITGSRGTFRRVISGIEKLKARGIWIKTRSVITSLNLNAVSPLVDMLAGMHVDQITIGPQHRGSCDVRCENSGEMLDPAGLERLRKTVERKTEQYPDCEIIYGDPETIWQGPEDVTFCGHPAEGMMVAANGAILPCEFIHDKDLLLGDARMSSLGEIWLGPDHRRFLEKALNAVDEDCRRCERLDECHTGCFNLSMIERGDYFSRDPRCPGPEKMKKRNI